MRSAWEAELAESALAAVFASVEAHAADPAGASAGRHARAAFDSYCGVSGEMEPVARAAVATLVPGALCRAALFREELRGDPAAPGSGQQYAAVLAELGELATALVRAPADEHAEAYGEVCAEIRRVLEAGEQAQPVWDAVRRSRAEYAAARGRPPARAPPRAPLADDSEYYAP